MKILEVIYENGVLKPLSELSLEEKERIKILIAEKDDIFLTDLFSGIIKGLNNETINEIALNPDFEIE